MHLKSLLHDLRCASDISRRPAVALLAEMIRLRLGRGRLGAGEYFDFRLYEPDRSAQDKEAFAGYRMFRILMEILIDEGSRIFERDKVSTYATLIAFGFPIPRIHALYMSGRRGGPFPCIENADDLMAYLRSPGNLPVYLKPAWGSYGRGNTVLRRCEGGRLTLGDGSSIDARSFCEGLNSTSTDPRRPAAKEHGRRPFGWVLQEVLSAHADIAAVCGDKVSGVRIHTFLTPRGPKIHRAVWKINAGRRDSDNFEHGASGNLLAAIDLRNGSAVRIVSGVGFSQTVNGAHPLSGKPLLGFRLPGWERIREVVLDASTHFPGLLCQGWDVAVCDDGPRLLEVNPIGDLDLSEHSHARGFLDEQFLAMLRERGLEELLYGGRAVWRRSPKTGRWGRRKLHWAW